MRNRNNGIEFEESSGNVFADLGLSNPDERLKKSDLAYEIFKIISSRKLTQREAAIEMGISQPKVSKIVRGELKGFSLEKLMEISKKLGVEYRVVKSSFTQTYESLLVETKQEASPIPVEIASFFALAMVAVSLQANSYTNKTTFRVAKDSSPKNSEKTANDQSSLAA